MSFRTHIKTMNKMDEYFRREARKELIIFACTIAGIFPALCLLRFVVNYFVM